MSTELGKAYVQIVPSAKGISGKISGVLGPEATKAGADAGKKVSESLGQKVSTGLQRVGGGLTKIGTIATVTGAAFVGIGAKAMAANQTQMAAESKLIEIYKTRMGVSEDVARNTMDLASSLQKVGVVGDEVALSGAQQLATFAQYPDTVNALLPAMENLLVQQKGVNATSEDATNIANLMGKVLGGQTGALKRVGITFDENQEKILKYGTEQEKAAALAEVITENVGNMNEAFAATPEGKIQQMKNALGDLWEQLGAAIAPALGDIATAISEKIIPKVDSLLAKLRDNPAFGKIAVAITGVLVAGGPLVVLLGKLTGSVGTLITTLPKIGLAISGISLPMVAVAAVIGVLVAAFIHLWKTNESFRDTMTAIWNRLKGAFELFGQGITDRLNAMGFKFKDFKAVVKAAWDGITKFLAPVFEGAFSTVVTIVETALGVILGAIDVFIAVSKGDWKGAFKALSGIFKTAWKGIGKIFSAQLTAIKKLLGGVLNNVKKTWSRAWENVKSATKKKATEIKNAVKSKLVDGIRSVLSKISFIKSKLQSAFETAKKAVTTKANQIKSVVSSKLVNGIKSALDKLGFIKSKLSSAFDSAKKAVTSKVNSIKNAVKNAFAKLTIKIPTPHIPKLEITWKKVKKGPIELDVPSISWHAAGGIFDRPTVLQGVGEAGAEAVIPLTQLWKRFDSMADSIVSGVATVVAAGSGGGGDIHLDVYLYPSGPKMMEQTVRAYDLGKKRGLK